MDGLSNRYHTARSAAQSPTDRSGGSNVKLAVAVTRYDEAQRLYEVQQGVFAASNESSIFTTLPSGRDVIFTPGGLATNSTANDHNTEITLFDVGAATDSASYVLDRSVFDRAGRTIQRLTDNTAVFSYSYDGAGRRIQTIDPLSNTVDTRYDGNSNVVNEKRTELCTISEPSVATEAFQAARFYDALNRPVFQAVQGADGTLDVRIFRAVEVMLCGKYLAKHLSHVMATILAVIWPRNQPERQYDAHAL